MKRNTLVKFSMAVVGGVLVAAFAATGAFSFAWFTNKNNVTKDFSGQTKGFYFASGDGTSEKPYVINRPIHLYNLAWLQYLGYFNEDEYDAEGNKGSDETIDKQYYFKIDADLNMSGWILPPIGTETKPFVGNFDGGNHTISNLTISNKIGTETGNITKHPSVVTEERYNETENPNIIGFFGVIGSVGQYSLTYTSSINSVSNFYLDGVKVYTYNSNVLCGMLAGYVNGPLTNAGVHYGNMNIASGTTNLSTYSFSNVSSYSLIGDYNKDKYSWEDDPDGGDVGYGTSTDIKALHNSLVDNKLISGSAGKISKKTALPFKYENATLIKGSDEKVSVTTYVSSIKKTVNFNASEYSTYKASTKGNNIGYYSGEVKTYQMSSLDYNIDDFGIQSGSGYNTQNAYLTTPPDDVLAYVKENGNYLIRLNSGTSYDDIRQYSFNYIENAQVGDWNGNLLIPTDGIWVAPKSNGKFKFVFYNQQYTNGGNVGILFMKLKRVTPGDYSSAFDYYSCAASGRSYTSKYGYFEYDATTDYEYFITFYTNNSSDDAPYIAYMDIGTNGGSDEDDRTSLKGFDFVEKDDNNAIVKISDAGYTKSGVAFKISNTKTDTASTSAYSFYFKRTGEKTVLYYYIPSTGGGLTLTPLGTTANTKEGSSSDFDDTTTSA